MGVVASAPPSLLLLAAFSRHHEALAWADQWAEEHFGAIALRSKPFAFVETDYYQDSMGSGLIKQFLAFETLFDPANLAGAKLATNEAEAVCADQSVFPDARPLNLDPGYLTLSKLVLASTKDHAHRIYLRDGIFAEITLRYQKRAWRPSDWTYPDYQRADFHEFFDRCRVYLQTRMRDG